MPPVTSSVVGVLTACTTRPSSSNTASVLVPPTSMPIRRMPPPPHPPRKRGRGDRRGAAIGWGLIEHRFEIEVVAEGARPDMLEALRRQKYRRRRQGDDRYPHAVADRLGAERIARYRIEDADQIGRHRNRLARLTDHAPRHNP